jgi:hypothetical protein
MTRGPEATASPSQEGERHPLSLPSTKRSCNDAARKLIGFRRVVAYLSTREELMHCEPVLLQ